MSQKILKNISKAISTWQTETWDRGSAESMLDYILDMAEEGIQLPKPKRDK